MNSDKVRIYDLSKELHLENKDVLAICSQLNIAVKSHSSTIGESEAERIRLVAKKYTARRTASPRELAATKQKAPSPMTAKAQSKPSSHDKEQILEIRKLNTQDRINPNSKGSPKVPPASVMMLTPPTRPEARPNQPEVTLVKADTDGTPAKNQQQISAKAPEVAEVAEVAEQQPLVKPPTRPVPPVPPTPVLTQPEPPVLTEPELSVLTQPEPPVLTQSEPPVLTQPEPPVLTQPEPPVLTQPKPPVLTQPKPPVLTEPEPSELKPEQVIETPNQSVETKTETTAKKSARRKKAATDQGAAKTQPALELLRPKPPRPVEPETTPVATRPQLTVVAPEPKVPQERPVEIAPTAKAPPEKPQPVKPPAKPVPPAAVTPETSQEEPPVKRDRVKKARQQPKETTTETAKREAPKAQQVVELRRPKPVRSVEAEIPAVALLPKPTLATAQPKAVDAKAPELLLDRPEPPRLAKGGKKRQEEEIDDDQESKAKAGKAGAKVKRLKPLVDDFEEDWEDTAEEDAATPISLAVVRPAKQKASVVKSPAIATLMTAAAKSKKSTNFRQQSRPEAEPQRTRPETLVVTGGLTVQELAQALAVQDTEIVKILFLKGKAVSITQSLDLPTITLVGEALEVKIETAEPEAQARKLTEMLDVEDLENLQRRPPVVTIMGHVDHGKTSLLDAIRHTKVAAGEAGGITQHIGAYHVDVEQDGNVQQVVFLDTPGHQAFTAMRARGARVTDIAILVVAADDGVQPQTVEAIGHAKAAGVPLVVAINKIDKPDAQPDRVKQELTEYGLVPEEWGGDTIMVPVSAIKGENLDTLLEMILLVAEVSDLQANPNRLAKGTVIEANLDKTRGSAATLLVQNGTLHVGDILVAGSAFGKVRAMIDDRGRRVQVASPSFAVEVLGLSEVPAAGDEFEVFQNEKEARAIATAKADKQRQSRLLQGRISLTNLSAQAQEGKLKELNLILKADVQGSVEAIVGALKQLPQNEVQLSLLLAAPGEITETDIDLAAASNAVIVGFNTTLASGARQAADAAGVDVRDYTIIYKLLEDIQDAMEGLLEPELVEQPLGTVEVRAVFPVGNGFVAGCYVQSGKVIRNSKLRVRRAGKVVYEGTIDSLKRMKEDVKEVNAGYECGIGVDKFNQWAESDIIEAYQMVTKRRTLSISK